MEWLRSRKSSRCASSTAPGPAPLDASALDADALRARVADRVRHLRATFSADIPAARNTLRQLLDGPARAVPVMVNGAPRYLVRGRLSADAVHSALATP